MKTYIYLLLFIVSISACQSNNNSEEKVTTITDETPEVLVTEEDNTYIKYYPGKDQIEITGPKDELGRRHGKWSFYGKDGVEISTTFYRHGKRHGHSIVNYSNGQIRYYGEYYNDEMVGEWKYYDEEGKLTSTKDFGTKE